MDLPASPLADQFASLRVAFAASPQGGWLPPALHALISACLARIFGRLEQLLLLWQAGNFAPLPARPSVVNPCATSDPRTLPFPARHAGQRMQLRDHRAAPAPIAPATSAPNRAARPAPSQTAPSPGTASARSPRRLRAARDPPPPRPPQSMQTPPSEVAQARP